MTIAFKPNETFRGDFTFRNSPAAIRRFPFPFTVDVFMYAVNIEPHTAGPAGSCFEFPIDVDEHYIAECRERALVLATTSNRCLALPHMLPAQWDVLELIMTSLSRDYPDCFQLIREGNRWNWTNVPLRIDHEFTFGDSATLPYEPLEYITRQTQGDCYLIALQELVTIPEWGRRLHRVLRNLHPALVEYKGLTRTRDQIVSWLGMYDC